MKNMNKQDFFCTILSKSFEQNSYLNLLQVGYDKCSPGYSYSNYRDMYIIHFVKQGNGTLEINGEIFNVKPNEAFLLRPNSLTICTADPVNPWQLYFFAFNGEFAEYLVEKTVFCKNRVIIKYNDNDICDTISDIALELYEKHSSQIHNLELLFKMLSFFEGENSHSTLDQTSHKQYYQYVYTAKKYISMNFANNIKVSDIASHLNINRSYLYKIFKKITGISIEEYIVSVKINEARRLLDETNLSIDEITSIIGYCSSAAFYKAFKQQTGLTPKQYKEMR